MDGKEFTITLQVRATTDDIIDLGASVVKAVSMLPLVTGIVDIQIRPVNECKTTLKGQHI